MRPRTFELLALGAGLACGLLLIGSLTFGPAGPGNPIVVLPVAPWNTIPPFHNATGSPATYCGTFRCGSPGEQWSAFTLTASARLSGALRTGAPIDLWFGNVQGMSAACSLSYPVPPCAPPAMGPAYLYESESAFSSFDFGQLQFNVAGAGVVLPPGDWEILLINWGDGPISVTIDSAVTATPIA